MSGIDDTEVEEIAIDAIANGAHTSNIVWTGPENGRLGFFSTEPGKQLHIDFEKARDAMTDSELYAGVTLPTRKAASSVNASASSRISGRDAAPHGGDLQSAQLMMQVLERTEALQHGTSRSGTHRGAASAGAGLLRVEPASSLSEAANSLSGHRLPPQSTLIIEAEDEIASLRDLFRKNTTSVAPFLLRKLRKEGEEFFVSYDAGAAEASFAHPRETDTLLLSRVLDADGAGRRGGMRATLRIGVRAVPTQADEDDCEF